MNNIYAKLKSKKNLGLESYRTVLAIEDAVYLNILDDAEFEFELFTTTRIPEDHLWFFIENFSSTSNADCFIKENWTTSEFDCLENNDYDKVELLIIENENFIYYQRITPSKLIPKKGLFNFGNGFEFHSEVTNLQLNLYPDAIYSKQEDRLYFRKIDRVGVIFTDIYKPYEEAIDEVVQSFLSNKFIVCGNGFDFKSVKKISRKKLTQVIKKMEEITPEQTNELLDYIKPYCPNLCIQSRLYKISSDKEFRLFLDGLCEQFYTKPISNEKTLAHSTSKI